MLAIYLGVCIGLIEPLQSMLFKHMSPLRPFGAALVMLGNN
jgi:hypothetical protein